MLDADDVEDLEEAPENEVEAAEEEILDQATAAATLAELKIEIATLGRLEALAAEVRRSGQDTKWRELAHLLGEIFTPAALGGRVAEPTVPYGAGPIPKPVPSPRQKLVLFTEHRDTLNYLERQIGSLLGRPQAVVLIHGGMGREERRKAQESFLHDPEVQVLLATDAAGEGINLQRAHLMVNYDLPWNPNRLEQRFGRIHRIGQTEVCHLWNLVAEETREGDVYRTAAREARGSAPGARRPGLRRARQAPVRGPAAARSPDRGDPLRRPARGARAPHPCHRARRGPAAPRRTCIEERALAHDAMDCEPRGARARGDGARRGAPPPAALHRVVLPRGLQASGRHASASASRAATRSPTCPRRCATATARSARAIRCCRATSASPSRRT